jgi:hypothetical protein
MSPLRGQCRLLFTRAGNWKSRKDSNSCVGSIKIGNCSWMNFRTNSTTSMAILNRSPPGSWLAGPLVGAPVDGCPSHPVTWPGPLLTNAGGVIILSVRKAVEPAVEPALEPELEPALASAPDSDSEEGGSEGASRRPDTCGICTCRDPESAPASVLLCSDLGNSPGITENSFAFCMEFVMLRYRWACTCKRPLSVPKRGPSSRKASPASPPASWPLPV